MKLRSFLIVCSLALAPACSKNSADSQVEKMVSMMEELGSAIEGADGDCGKMADSVEGVVKKYEGDLQAMKDSAAKAKGDPEKAKELMEKYGDRLKAAMPKMMGMMKCASDPKMKELGDKLEGMM